MHCPHCGLDYDHFRTGLTFAEVYQLIYTRAHKRRHGVLGYWHELKLKQFAEHVAECSYYASQASAPAPELAAHA